VTELDASSGLMTRPLDRIGASRAWLTARLREAGIEVHPGSELARALGNLDDLRAKALRGELFRFSTTDAAYDFFASAVGADFLSKSLHWGFERGFRLDPRRWRDLASGDPIVTKVGVHSTQRNLTWEVIIASLASTFAKMVTLDEPDVRCSFRGKTFAIAAKVAYSERKLFDNVEDGFRQANGTADGALVFVDVVNLYPVVDTLRWSRGKRFSRNDETVVAMTDSFTRWCERFDLRSTAKKLRERARNPVGVAFFVPMFIEVGGQPVPFLYTHLPITWAGESEVDYDFAKAFLHACNVTLSFEGRATD
jgi:hypothetical protein